VERYSPELMRRPSLVVLSKCDITTPSRRRLKMEHDFLISAVAGRRVTSLLRRIGELLEDLEAAEPRQRYAGGY